MAESRSRTITSRLAKYFKSYSHFELGNDYHDHLKLLSLRCGDCAPLCKNKQTTKKLFTFTKQSISVRWSSAQQWYNCVYYHVR